MPYQFTKCWMAWLSTMYYLNPRYKQELIWNGNILFCLNFYSENGLTFFVGNDKLRNRWVLSKIDLQTPSSIQQTLQRVTFYMCVLQICIWLQTWVNANKSLNIQIKLFQVYRWLLNFCLHYVLATPRHRQPDKIMPDETSHKNCWFYQVSWTRSLKENWR